MRRAFVAHRHHAVDAGLGRYPGDFGVQGTVVVRTEVHADQPGDPAWPKVPDGYYWSITSGVTVDAKDHVYVFDRHGRKVIKKKGEEISLAL